MKNIYIYITIVLQLLLVQSLNAQTGQCLGGGCSTGAAWGATQSTTSGTFVNSVGITFGGEYNTYNVTLGQQYEWSLCPSDGATVGTNTDSQLSLRRNNNNNPLCYSDDLCGTHAKILWTATYTGVVRVYVHTYNCAALSTSHTVRWRCVSCSPPPAAPVNDACASATNLPCGTSGLAGTTVNSVSETVPAGAGSNFGVWYTFTGDGQNTTITSTTTFDHRLTIFTGACGTNTILVSQDGSTGTETVTFATTNGLQYRVYVSHYLAGSTTTGTFNISRTCAPAPTPPSNDACSAATNLPCGTSGLAGTTVNSVSETAPGGGGLASNFGVWYTFTGDGGQTTISSTGTGGFDHEMTVLSGSCGALTLLSSQDGFGGNGTETYTFNTVNGTVYYVYVAHWLSSGTSANVGTFTISRTCVAPCPTPSNDLCANAPILNLGASNNQTHLGTGCGSTANLGTYKDVWVAFTVPCGGMNVTIDFCGSTPVHNNAYINISPDCSFTTFTGATTWDFTSCVDGNIRLYWNNVPAGTYYYPILIDPTWETNYVLNISGTPLYTPAVAPTSISGTTTVCSGQSTTLTLQGGSAGTNGVAQWFEGSCGSAVIATGNSITVSPTVNTTYFVRYAGSCNTTACASTSITVNGPTGIAPTNGDMVWKGATNTDWGTLNNWWQYNGTSYVTATAAPTAAQDVIIPANQTCVLNQPNTFANGGNAKSLRIETGANLTMGNGTLTVAENWVNNGTYTPGSGTVTFTGTGNHSISGSSATHAFNNLTMNKNGEIILSVPIIIAGSLTLTDGRLNIVNFNLDLPTNTINFGNASSFVKTSGTGTLNRNVAGIPVSFPVGRSAYNPATLTNSGTADKYSIRVIDNVTDIGTNADAGAPTTMAVVMRTWMINEQDAGGSNVTLGLNWNGAPEQFNGFQQPSAFIAHYMSGAGLWDNIGGTVSTNSIVTSGITSFSPFTISSDLNFAPLPVELMSFSSVCLDNDVAIKWTTASENNSMHFVVETSTDALNWEVLSVVPAAQFSTSILNYAITHEGAARNKNYYRLKQVDLDGAVEFFNVIYANCGNVAGEPVVFPNPSYGNFTIDFSGAEMKGDVQLSIMNTEGKEISNREVNLEEGVNTYQINNMELQPGIYYLKIVDTTGRSFIIKHSFI